MENDAKVYLSADVSNFQQQLKIATGSLAKFQTDAGRVTSGLKSAFAALGVGLSVNAFSEMLKGTIEAADRLGKLSQSVGVSVESLSALKYSAGLSDISLEQLGKGMEKLSKNMLSVEQGSGSAVSGIEALGVTAKGGAAAAFAQLNINVEQSKGHLKSSEAVMLEVADKFAGMKDGAVKTAVAMQIFGKSGADLIPLLNQGSAAIEAQRLEAERLGIVISTDMAKASEEFNDNLKRLTARSEALKISLANDLLPALNDIANAFLELNGQKSDTEGFFSGIGTGAKYAAAAVGSAWLALKDMRDGIGAIGAMLVTDNATALLIGKDRAGQSKKNDNKIKDFNTSIFKGPSDTVASMLAEQNKGFDNNKTDPKVNIAPKNSSGSADDPAKKLLENSLKNYEFLAGQESEIFASRNKFLDLYNKENLISIKGYYDSRKAAQEENISNTLVLYDKEIATLEAYSAKAAKATDRAEATGKINELIAKKTKLQQTAAEASIFASVEETRAFKDLQNQIAGVNAQVLEFTGNLHAAAVIRFDQQNEDLRKRFGAEGNSGALEQLEFVKKFTLAQVDLNKITQDGALIQGAAANAETRIGLAQKSGSLSEIQALQAISSIRVKEGDQLEALYLSYKKIADDSGNPKLIQDADDMKVALEKLRSESDLVGQKFGALFSDTFSNAFAGFVTGTKSASDAFKAFGNTVAAELSKLAAQQFSMSAKKLFSDGSGKDGGGKSTGTGKAVTESPGLWSAIAGLFGFADGGVMTSKGAMPLRSYAGGGVASSPQLAMFGEGATNEAFVPLPDGRSIPVKMHGGGGGINITNNIDARGADIGMLPRLQAMMEANNRRLKAELLDNRRRNGVFA